MNIKARSLIKNFTYTLTSNLISLIVSSLVVIVVPRLIGIEEYGYWQLYLFYSSYVGFLQFGWTDGIYLRYGGVKYGDLNKKLFFSQFWMLVISQLVLSIMIVFAAKVYVNIADRRFIIYMVTLCLIATGIRAMILFILQATNLIKEYARIIILGQILYFSIIILFLIFGIRDYKLLIVADLVGRFTSLIYGSYCCKDIIFRSK